MEPGKLYDGFALFCMGMIAGIWFCMNAVTHDLVASQGGPCSGCAKKRVEKEVNDG